MLSSLLSFEGLSVEIVLAAVLADDYAAVVYVFGHTEAVAGCSIEPMPSVVESNEMPTKLAAATEGTLR